jgi:hypothetical protein
MKVCKIATKYARKPESYIFQSYALSIFFTYTFYLVASSSLSFALSNALSISLPARSAGPSFLQLQTLTVNDSATTIMSIFLDNDINCSPFVYRFWGLMNPPR